MMKKDATRDARDPLSFAAALAGYQDHFRVRNFSPRGWEWCYLLAVKDLVRFASQEGITRVSEVTYDLVRRYQQSLMTEPRETTGRPLKPATVAVRTAVLRSFFQWAAEGGLVVEDPTARLRSPRVPRPLPRGLLAKREAALLLEQPDPSTALGQRDRAMLEVLYGCGIRASELTGLTVNDLDASERTIRIRAKGGRTRLVPLGRRAFRAVLDYAEGGARDELLGTTRQPLDFLFLSYRGRRFGKRVLLRLVKLYARKAGIEKLVTVHGLRHSCGTHLLRGGADIRAIQELLGHKSIATTERYTHLATADLRRAILKHHPRERMQE